MRKKQGDRTKCTKTRRWNRWWHSAALRSSRSKSPSSSHLRLCFLLFWLLCMALLGWQISPWLCMSVLLWPTAKLAYIYIINVYKYIYIYVSCCLLLAGLQKKDFPWNWIPQESPPKNAKTIINKDTKQAAEEPVQFLLAVTALETLEVLSLLSSQSEQHIVSKSGTALHRLAILIVFFLNHPFWGTPMESSTLTLSSLSLYLRAFGSIPRPCTVLSLWYGEASQVQWVRPNEPWKCR